MNTYTYTINDMVKDDNGIVVTVMFSVTASDGTDSYTHNYQTGLPAPKNTIIPFADLTKEGVIAWVKTLVGEDTEKQADAELEAFKKRKVTTTGLPW